MRCRDADVHSMGADVHSVGAACAWRGETLDPSVRKNSSSLTPEWDGGTYSGHRTL